MVLLILEALAAAGLLGLIVWWTMFSGRKGGERIDDDDEAPPNPPDRPDRPDRQP